MTNLSLKGLKAIAKLRKVKDYKSKSKDELTKILIKPEPKIIIKKIKNLMKQGVDFLNQK